MTHDEVTRGIRDSITERELREMLNPRDFEEVFKVRRPDRQEAETHRLEYQENHAFQRPQPPLPADHVEVGNIPIRTTEKGPIVPDLADLHRHVRLRPWLGEDWERWWDILVGNPCLSVPGKSSRTEIPVTGEPRTVHVSDDCGRVFTVNSNGLGSVVNVVTENVDATFQVDTDPSAQHAGVSNPVVSPFTKGGINHEHQELYVPASFYRPTRVPSNGGFYVAVVDVDPSSPTYLDTVDHVPCGWIPEEVAFTDDGATGVIANYMQGTLTIFDAANHNVLEQELDGFDGASQSDPGGAWSRSVRCADVPGVGNRAFLTLTEDTSADGTTPPPGIAIVDLDDPNHPRTNFSHDNFHFVDGVAVTPDNRQVLLVEGVGSAGSGVGNQLHVVNVDTEPPTLERTISLPRDEGQSYFGGIAVRPTGNLAFVATGTKDPSPGSNQGDDLVCVNYETGATAQLPNGLAPFTWGLEIHQFGDPLKPYLFVSSLSGKVSIVPC